MKRIVILGRGAAGKSTLARVLGEITGLPVTKLDDVFWGPGLVPTPPDAWVTKQSALAREPAWILDGDLGPYDAVHVRLAAADTVILLDFSLVRCAVRALLRSRERADFWIWLLWYRTRSLPQLRSEIATHAPTATVHVLRNPRAVRDFIGRISAQVSAPSERNA